MMTVPLLKRENTIGITFTEGVIKDELFEEIIEGILGVNEDEIEGLDDRGAKKFLFKVTTKERYEDICNRFVGRDIVLKNGFKIQVEDISSYRTRVSIKKVPFEINNAMLKEMLERYGKVYKCQYFHKKYGKYKKYRNAGNRAVWMELNHSIPQYLFLNQTKTHLHVSYENQPFSCNNCGDKSHGAKNCQVSSPEEYVNAVDVNVCEISEIENTVENGIISTTSAVQDVNNNNSVNKCTIGSSLKEHMDIHTGEKPNACSESDSNSDINQNSTPCHEMYKCTVCDYEINSEDTLKEHMAIHTGEQSISCSKNSKISKVKKHSGKSNGIEVHIDPSQSENSYICTFCDYRCAYEDIFKTHMEAHTGEKPFPCSKCDYPSSTMHELADHLRVHGSEKSFKCKICEFLTMDQTTLQNHVLAHKGDKMLYCSDCDYSCKNEDILKTHSLSHKGAKPYACTECDFKCNAIKTLKTHKKIHKNNKNIVIFKCSKCENSFTSKGEMNMHMKAHSGENFIDESFYSIVEAHENECKSKGKKPAKRSLSVSPEVNDGKSKIVNKGTNKRNKKDKVNN